MIKKIRKYLSPKTKERIMHSLPFRVWQRINLKNHKINFSCELTTKCNAFCDMCTRISLIKNKKLPVKDMDERVIERILEEMKKFHKSGKKIYFSPMGLGEPFLFPHLYDLFKKIKTISKDIEIVFVTNGLLLDKEASQKLISLGVDEITISLNCNSAYDYKKCLGVDAYDKVYKNIENLIKLRNKTNKNLPRIFVQYLDYKGEPSKFKSDIKKWLKIMKHYDKCYVHRVANQAGFAKKGNSTNFSSEKYPCNQPLWRIAIKINGDVYPCDPCFYSGTEKIPSLYLGNILTTDLFKQFFSAENKQKKIINAMKKSDYSFLPNCEKCNTYKLAPNLFFKIPKFLRKNRQVWF